MFDKIPFGRTGHDSVRIIFGGFAVGYGTQDEADRLLDVLLEYGINHIDTAPSYGESELRIGPWMKDHRDQFFLATKTLERTYDKAREELHKSLERLRVSQIDMLQLHYLVDPQEWDVAMGPGGALEALIDAREEGLIRFIGVTGHDVSVAAMHKKSLERFEFDAVLLPFSHILMQNPQYSADFETLAAMCKERGVALQTIKAVTRRPWASQHDKNGHPTWYEPLTEQGDIDKAVHWVLGRGGVFLNTTGDINVLPKVLDAAKRFAGRPSDDDMQALLAKAEMSPLFV